MESIIAQNVYQNTIELQSRNNRLSAPQRVADDWQTQPQQVYEQDQEGRQATGL
jgi:hypothetical protein